MKKLLQKRLFSISIAFVIMVNIFIFVHIFINKTDEPTSHIYLSLRELYYTKHHEFENSGISLRLIFRSPSFREETWLDEEKLKEIGFTTNELNSNGDSGQNIKKELFIVLEQNAESYQKSLQIFQDKMFQAKALYEDNNEKQYKRKYEDAEFSYQNAQIRPSRLFAIDAGKTYTQLRNKYPDITTYIIVKGVVSVVNTSYEPKRGVISELSIPNIYLPKKLHKDFLAKYNNKQDDSEEFIEVKYGPLYEPWISNIR